MTGHNMSAARQIAALRSAVRRSVEAHAVRASHPRMTQHGIAQRSTAWDVAAAQVASNREAPCHPRTTSRRNALASAREVPRPMGYFGCTLVKRRAGYFESGLLHGLRV